MNKGSKYFVIVVGIAISLLWTKYNSMNNPLDKELSDILSTLWEMDENHCQDGIHYQLDMQGRIFSSSNDFDAAEHHLFSWLNEDAIFQMPTYKAFYDLLDNYEVNVGDQEIVTKEEIYENWTFLEECLKTSVMKKAHEYLVNERLASPDINEFKKKLYNMWFRLYRRSENIQDSSGFEHVFVGEVKDGTVLGMHNWIQFVMQEKAGNVDYRGFYHKGKLNEESPRIISLKFTWGEDRMKPIGSTLIGTSPELELAMYTVAFLVLQERNIDNIKLKLAGYNVQLYCHPIARGKVGTCYFKKL